MHTVGKQNSWVFGCFFGMGAYCSPENSELVIQEYSSPETNKTTYPVAINTSLPTGSYHFSSELDSTNPKEKLSNKTEFCWVEL